MSLRLSINGPCIAFEFVCVLLLSSACLDPSLVELNPCLVSGVIEKKSVNKLEKIDLLFVVDNSVSMQQEQDKLRDQLPRMIKVLTTGDKTPNDGIENRDFTPVKDLHLAVVTSDMGLPTITAEQSPDRKGACMRNSGTGDDGNFVHYVSQAARNAGLNCSGSGSGGYPIFIQHIRENDEDLNQTRQRADTTAKNFSCIATLGTTGCGYEMQLEAALKALWPSQINNLTQAQQALNIHFLSGSQGHGDIEHESFLRGTVYHPTEPDQFSLLAIIVVTDEEDCSAGALGNLDFLTLDFIGGNNIKDANLRCYKDGLFNWENRYPVERYIEGFKALRPGYDDMVVFAAIAGIPSDIREDADGDKEITEEERERYYRRILNDPRMTETAEDPELMSGELMPSCVQTGSDPLHPETEATPARRLTEVARGFGAGGVIRSICAPDFTPAMDAIIDAISNKLGGICLPRAYTRNAKNLVDCNVIWTMPEGATCAERYLKYPPRDQPQTKEGRQLCVVDQIPVVNHDTHDPAQALDLTQEAPLGWYYDDFSLDMKSRCPRKNGVATQQRISFTLTPGMEGANEDPPTGVSVDLECLQMLPTPSSHPVASLVLKPCGSDNPACPKAPVEVGQLFCHDASNRCVVKCGSDADCKRSGLGGWICDARTNPDGSYVNESSSPICVNPTCN
ncbi:MAG: hypothetical protein JXA30_08465 [Deltaproteobacteria bacterium]|nr:hypothetical protein [Deltaproteobacteria bacterium]